MRDHSSADSAVEEAKDWNFICEDQAENFFLKMEEIFALVVRRAKSYGARMTLERADSKSIQPPTEKPLAPAKRKSSAPERFCPNCSAELEDRRCKLMCLRCGFYLSCSDFY
jgi:hypothetical protein